MHILCWPYYRFFFFLFDLVTSEMKLFYVNRSQCLQSALREGIKKFVTAPLPAQIKISESLKIKEYNLATPKIELV